MARTRTQLSCLAIVLAACLPVRRPATLSAHERALGAALEVVTYGDREAARAADLVLVRAADGAVRIARAPVAPAPGDLDDRAIESEVRGRLSTDPLVATLALDVDVDRGVVVLAGHVHGPRQAARAVDIAARVAGARAVLSRLTWVPGATSRDPATAMRGRRPPP